MDNSELQSKSSEDLKLSKCEILRGYDSFNNILQNSKTLSTEYLKAFVSNQFPERSTSDFTKSPLFTGNVKVGFIIAKKKIRKAFLRNRIRRLLKESYRLNKNQSGLFSLELNIIFSLTDKGYKTFKNVKGIKLDFINTEMILLASKIKFKFPPQ